MAEPAFFSVDTRLASLLGETYRSTEAAIKELVDNAWDADADNVWITLPAETSHDRIVVQDDGLGMTPEAIRREYLVIARDRRSRMGQKSAKYQRPIKGRKGIGKFAGLAVAQNMRVVSCANGWRTTLLIDRSALLDSTQDLENIPLPLTVEKVHDAKTGTTVELSSLNPALFTPREDVLRAMLFYEYGRSKGLTIFVNGSPLSFEDALGPTHEFEHEFDGAGKAVLKFCILDKKPKYPGFVLKVAGKTVGKPTFLGLDEDSGVPSWILDRVFGELSLEELPEGHVTADWGAIFENSAPYKKATEWARHHVLSELQEAFRRDFELRKAHINREIRNRLQNLPEYRRKFAEDAINKVLWKFYRDHPQRISALANVMLDALERDEYWAVLQRIEEASHGDVAQFAEALESFGLLELAMMSANAKRRLLFLDNLEKLTNNPETLEATVHKAIENSLWVLGAKYSMMASNTSLRNIINRYTDWKYSGTKATKRPDLLLAQDASPRYLLIEFKRPSHTLTRADGAQAAEYRDELSTYLPSRLIDVVVLGGQREKMDPRYDTPNLEYQTYSGMISQARYELEWLIHNLTAFN